MLPDSFIEQVKQATDLLELAKEYTTMKKAGPNVWQGICPHPDHHDTNPSFTVWEKEQSWCCYGCHHGKKDKTKPKSVTDHVYGSDCFAFLQWLSKGKLSWKDTVFYLADLHGIPIPTDENQAYYDRNLLLAKSYAKNLPGRANNYLHTRGLSDQDIAQWGLGFDGKKITFPLYDRYNNILGFSKRWIDMPEGKDDKYRNSPNNKIFNKSVYFYGMNHYDSSFDEIRITEGNFDVILGHKYNVKNMVGPLGTSFTENHVEVIKSLGKTPVFCFDGDLAGLKALKKAIDALAEAGVYSKILLLPDGMDMAELALLYKEKTEEYIVEHAVTYGYFKIKDIISYFDAKTNELKLKLYPDILKVLEDVPGDEQTIIRSFIKDRLQVEL